MFRCCRCFSTCLFAKAHETNLPRIASRLIFTTHAGEWQRWRLLNAGHQASVSLVLPQCTMALIAMDGVYLTQPRYKTYERPLVLPPGARGDVAVMCNNTGSYQLLSRENPDMYNLGQQEGFNSGVIMLVTVTGPHLDMEAPTALPPHPAYLADLVQRQPRNSNMTVQWDLLYMINNTVGRTDIPIYGVSGRAFNASTLEPTTCIERDDTAVEQWRIQNPIWICNASLPTCLTTMDRDAASGPLLSKYLRPVTLSHGFHMHTFKFQVYNDSNNGRSFDYEPGDWRDTIMTPLAGHVDVRFQPGTFEGRIPYHCHMSPHSDRGMIALYEVASACPAPHGSQGNAAGAEDAHTLSSSSPTPAPPYRSGPWEPALSNYTMPITTDSPKAQALFDEAMQLAFGFARDAAVHFFNLSLQADSQCAMCAWGVAYASGPFLNHPICSDPSCSPGASYASLARRLADNQPTLTPKEKLLINAIGLRYSGNPKTNATQLSRQYADALNSSSMIAADSDVAAFYAEATMLLHCVVGGYNFYNTTTGMAFPEIAQATEVLESKLLDPATRKVLPPPRQPFAEHLYMHITEPSHAGFGNNSAGRSLGVADRVRADFNQTEWQHLQHMSGHIYLRTGRYGDVVAVNKEAHASDAIWLKSGLVPYGPGHNVVFLIYGACMDGQKGVAEQYGLVLRDIYAAAPGE